MRGGFDCIYRFESIGNLLVPSGSCFWCGGWVLHRSGCQPFYWIRRVVRGFTGFNRERRLRRRVQDDWLGIYKRRRCLFLFFVDKFERFEWFERPQQGG